MTYVETDVMAALERLAGDDLATLTPEQWSGFDQFHSGGSEAVDRLLPSLHIRPGMTVLDVGAGFGGPARQIARGTGCSVVGVDITPAYVDAARDLTYLAGLADQVRFFCSDIAAFDRTDFDAAYTMHVQMNVADKKTYFSEIARRLRPGASFATFEVCRSGAIEPPPPLPWSLDGSDSFLVTADELCDTITSSGFQLVEWVDETAWVRQWFDGLAGRLAAAPTPLVLPALLTDGPARMLNFLHAVATGAVSIHRGAFVLAR